MAQNTLSKTVDKRIRYVDGLRAIACLIVLCAHLLSVSGKYAKFASGCGKIGVWFFMLISGYCSLKPYIDGKQFSIKQLPKYYLKKIVKIYPLYIVSLGIAFAFGFINFQMMLRSLILVEAWGHFWFVPVIIKFYLAFPIILIIYDALKSVFKSVNIADAVFSVLLLAMAVGFCFLFPFNNYPENSIMIRWYVPIFIMGFILALIEKHVIIKIPFFDVLTVLAAFTMLVFTPAGRLIIFGQSPSGWLQNKYLLMGGLWFVALLGLIFADDKLNIRIKNVLGSSKVLEFISKISFEVYLLHFIIMMKVSCFDTIPISVKWIIVIVLSVGLGYILNKLQQILISKINFDLRKDRK